MLTNRGAIELLFLLILVVSAHLSGCSSNCWSGLYDKYVALSLIQMNGDLNGADAIAARREIGDILENCEDRFAWAYPVSGLGVGSKSYITRLDMAVMADDSDLVVRELQRSKMADSRGIEDAIAMYDNRPIFLAAFFESPNAVKALIAAGQDVNETDEDGLTALHVISGSNVRGLRIIRLLVLGGASAEIGESSAPSVFELAGQQGDLRKIECLHLLGLHEKSNKDVDRASGSQVETARENTMKEPSGDESLGEDDVLQMYCTRGQGD